MNMRRTALTLNAIALLAAGAAMGQSASSERTNARLTLRSSNDVVMYLAGTTPVKDWKMCAHGLTGESKMTFSIESQLQGIEALSFSLPVRNLKGDEEGMQEDAYRALKADQFKYISFNLISATVQPAVGPYQYMVKALGNLSVAGVTRLETLTMSARVANGGMICFTGSEQLKMSDFNVERPSVLFGVVRAADEMTLSYKLIFSK